MPERLPSMNGEMIYKTKIDWWLGLILFIVAPGFVVLVPAYAFMEGDPVAGYVGLGVVVFYGALLFGFLFPMYYEITDETLVVRHGLVRRTMPLESIQNVTPSRNPISSPALSLDRLNIDRGTRLPLLISPDDKEGFLKNLAGRCAHLKLEGDRLVVANQ